MDIQRLREKLAGFSEALNRLKEALERDQSDDIVLDAVIQRFEFTYELSWKLIKAYMSYSGIADVKTPRQAFKEAFAAGLIEEGDVWLGMLDDRNVTSHTYDQNTARCVYEKVKNRYYPAMSKLKEAISREIEQ
ncbi:nucleotidyltransferase substrate binding protein (TIGR01987 family) [Caldicoprobacter guelmensis]|uniref:nucleotidyltransferase substrate binding protein n=1 Tax=Caldicoprobacter guelmensis TaxID=1170224 RepID=UPI00195B25A9|nr:nucleotidyltransferase substrate binding protein [Caldicoprobacter guelmensis]MBM7583179.1 nucleotidyltransferase substrate binding protein (TIGR01987 family) [Caldicoprobacter guelmensis]